MRRREFITLLGGAVATWPITAHAQSTKGPARIGLLPLGSQSNAYDRSLVEAFRRGLADAGLMENRDIVLDIVWTTDDPNAAVSELLSGKYVEIARELDGSQVAVDYLWHMPWPDGQNRFEATVRAADALGVTLRARGIGDVTDLDDAIISIKQSGAVAVIVQPSPFMFQQRAHIVDFATKQGLGTVYAFTVAGRDGALVAYGPDYADIFRRAANYVDRIIKGARPANLPVQQPVKLDLIVNLKTARALGLTMPATLLARATEVIE